MNLPARIAPMGVDEYLEGEQASELRHEYVAGQVFVMAEVVERHNRISGNIAFHLRAATRGTPCGTYISDMKLRVAAYDAFYYPDVVLACDPADDASLYKTAPCLVAEVLSPATEVVDRREKLVAYRTLPSLRYYLLVSQDTRTVEVYDLQQDGSWRHTILQQEGIVEFRCGGIEIRFGLDDIYEDVPDPVPS